jgi:hypothetical protein
MKKTSLILLWLISMISLSFCFKEPILRQNTTPIHVKFKSIKCNVADPSVVKIPFCHIKPLSRLHSSMNVGLILKKIIYGPLEVVLSVNYRHGTIYRQMKKRTFNYCELFKNGSFISKNPVHMVMFLMLKDRLPDFAYNGCPFPAGVSFFNFFNCQFLTQNKLFFQGFQHHKFHNS